MFFPFPVGRFQGISRYVEKLIFSGIRSAVHGPLLAPSVSEWKDKRKSSNDELNIETKKRDIVFKETRG